jgi:hypothetical protein
MHPSPLVPIALFGWLPLVVVSFTLLPPRRAVIGAFLVSWLFLPVYSYPVPGVLPDYTKMVATTIGVLLGVLIFDSQRIFRFRPRWIDLPVLLWCLAPVPSALHFGTGLQDGLSAATGKVFAWGLPFLIGRLYFSDWRTLRELAIAIVVGGLIYVPLCLYEIRFSPQLNVQVYGFHQHSFEQSFRGGGWRPVVFLDHGLMVGMWMATAAFLAYVLWRSRSLMRLGSVPMSAVAGGLFLTSLLVKSTGAFVLLLIGIAVYEWTRRIRSHLPLLIGLVVVPATYLAVRATGLSDGQFLADIAAMFSTDRQGSMQFRIDAENLLLAKAHERPFFGWTPWAFSEVYDEFGNATSVVTDSLWIITLGQRGFLGLITVFTTMLLPIVLVARRAWAKRIAHPMVAPTFALGIVLALYAVDNLVNAMVNPVYMLIAGGLCALRGAPSFAVGTVPEASAAAVPTARPTLKTLKPRSPRHA